MVKARNFQIISFFYPDRHLYKKVRNRLIGKYFFNVFFCICMIAFICPKTNAYVLSGPHLLDLMVKNLGADKRLQVNQKLIIYPSKHQTDQAPFTTLTETLSYEFPENFRLHRISENTVEIHLVTAGEALTVRDEKIVSATETELSLYKDLLLYRSRSLLEQKLPALGVNLSVSSLGRFEGKIAYIIGAEYPDESVSQIWIDQKTFRPMRWITLKNTDEGATETQELRYLNWRKNGRTWYPMQIKLYQDTLLVRVIQVESLSAVSSFPDTFFNIAVLKSAYPPIIPDMFDDQEPDDLNEIKKTIEDFNKLFEQ